MTDYDAQIRAINCKIDRRNQTISSLRHLQTCTGVLEHFLLEEIVDNRLSSLPEVAQLYFTEGVRSQVLLCVLSIIRVLDARNDADRALREVLFRQEEDQRESVARRQEEARKEQERQDELDRQEAKAREGQRIDAVAIKTKKEEEGED